MEFITTLWSEVSLIDYMTNGHAAAWEHSFETREQGLAPRKIPPRS